MNGEKLLKIGIFILFSLFLIITFLFITSFISKITFFSILTALIITSLNFAAGLFLYKMGIKQSHKNFSKIIFGGMFARLFFTLIIVFICLKFLNVSQNSFIFSILFLYFFYWIIEISYLILIKK